MSGRVTIDWDDSELKKLSVDLTEASGRIQRSAPKVVKRGAELIDKEMVKDARGHRYLPRFPRNISHGMVDRFTAEIGYNRSAGRQGSLVWIILHGSINNAPIWDYTAAARRSTPAIEEMFAGDAQDATLGVKET